MRTNRANVILECKEVAFEGLIPCFEEVKGVTKFLLLVLEGLDEVSE